MTYGFGELELRDLGMNQDERERFMASAMIAQGSAFLDIRRPGWDECIDLDRLSGQSNTNDVLGQLYGDFNLGCDTLGISDTVVDRLGFCGGSDRHIDEAWKTEILRRRAVRASKFMPA